MTGCAVTRRQVVVARWRMVAIPGLTRPTRAGVWNALKNPTEGIFQGSLTRTTTKLEHYPLFNCVYRGVSLEDFVRPPIIVANRVKRNDLQISGHFLILFLGGKVHCLVSELSYGYTSWPNSSHEVSAVWGLLLNIPKITMIVNTELTLHLCYTTLI